MRMIAGFLTALFTIGSLPLAARPTLQTERLKRLDQVRRNGRGEMCRRIAREVVEHGAKKWGLAEWAAPQDLARARQEVDDFLRQKLGGQTAVCAQYVSAGYGHFRKGYADEAAAAIAGLKLPGNGRADFAIRKEVAHKLVEEALYGALLGYCVYGEASPNPNHKANVEQKTLFPKDRPPYVNNQGGIGPRPQNPTQDPGAPNPGNPYAPGKDTQADPAEMKACQEKARQTARGGADFAIKGDVGFAIPSTSRYDVKTPLLRALIESYQVRRLDSSAGDLLRKAETRFRMPGTAQPPRIRLREAGGQTLGPRVELTYFLHRAVRSGQIPLAKALNPEAQFLGEAGAALAGVRFYSGPSEGRAPFAVIPASLVTDAVLRELRSIAPNIAAGREAILQRPAPISEPLAQALLDAARAGPGGSSVK